VCTNQGSGPFWGPERGYDRGNFGCLKTIPLTNHGPKCIDIWYEATLGQGDSSVRKYNSWGYKLPCPKGTYL